MSARRHGVRTSLKDHMQRIYNEYMEEFGVSVVDPYEVATWARDTGRWVDLPQDRVRQFAQALKRAMHDDYFLDPQGREVRRLHAAPRLLPDGSVVRTPDGRMIWDWAVLFSAKPDHMRMSLKLRRDAMVDDAWHHLEETKSYNDNNIHGAHLPLFDYDINKDLAEKQMPKEWPDEKPDGDQQ